MLRIGRQSANECEAWRALIEGLHAGSGRCQQGVESQKQTRIPEIAAELEVARRANGLTPRLRIVIDLTFTPPSSSGPGYLVLSQGTGVRVPVGVLLKP